MDIQTQEDIKNQILKVFEYQQHDKNKLFQIIIDLAEAARAKSTLDAVGLKAVIEKSFLIINPIEETPAAGESTEVGANPAGGESTGPDETAAGESTGPGAAPNETIINGQQPRENRKPSKRE